VDFVFIDGRYRVACALHVLPHLKEGGKIAIHDYMNRKEYHVIEEFYDRIENIDSAAIFVPKKDVVVRRGMLDKYLGEEL